MMAASDQNTADDGGRFPTPDNFPTERESSMESCLHENLQTGKDGRCRNTPNPSNPK